jgi:hypothetical protein
MMKVLLVHHDGRAVCPAMGGLRRMSAEIQPDSAGLKNTPATTV